jgi:hypothetical protein
MKFNCGPTPQEKHEAKKKWHHWFAWYPVRIASGDCRWLETVERKGKWYPSFQLPCWEWEYRSIKGK